MSCYSIKFSPKARRQLRNLSPLIQKQIGLAIEQLAEDPRSLNCKKMQGMNAWRIRTGNYRVMYEIHDGIVLILVLALGHRRDVYR